MIPSSLPAVLAALAFLGSAGLLVLLAGVAVYALVERRRRLARLAGWGAAGLLAAYLCALAVVGLLNPERTLAPGTEKYFCEFDCHLAYSVVALDSLGPVGGDSTAWVVSVRTRFDERTIASWRPREAPLSPGPRRVRLLVTGDQLLAPAADNAARLARLGVASTPIDTELRPGVSYVTSFVFDLPGAARPVSLDLEDQDLFPNRWLIGHEQSLLHGRILLGLPPSSSRSG
ncbi:MAG TPA: hypothetical protein VMG41_09950 [Gemmatimonadales bacterium]|nr:hypothetical protein [Gemmatimonadales bacterium]